MPSSPRLSHLQAAASPLARPLFSNSPPCSSRPLDLKYLSLSQPQASRSQPQFSRVLSASSPLALPSIGPLGWVRNMVLGMFGLQIYKKIYICQNFGKSLTLFRKKYYFYSTVDAPATTQPHPRIRPVRLRGDTATADMEADAYVTTPYKYCCDATCGRLYKKAANG